MQVKKNNNPTYFDTTANYENGDNTYDYDKFSINILDAEFMTSHELKYEKKRK